jgi:hypothetical protein
VQSLHCLKHGGTDNVCGVQVVTLSEIMYPYESANAGTAACVHVHTVVLALAQSTGSSFGSSACYVAARIMMASGERPHVPHVHMVPPSALTRSFVADDFVAVCGLMTLLLCVGLWQRFRQWLQPSMNTAASGGSS